MPDAPTPRITRAYDTTRFRAGNRVDDVTAIEFMLGELGPFTVDVPRGADQFAIADALRQRAAALTPNL